MGSNSFPFPLIIFSLTTNYQFGHSTLASKELAREVLCLNAAYVTMIIKCDSWNMTDSINNVWRWDTIVSLPTLKQVNSWTIQM